MSKVAVGERVGTVLEPHDDRMQLAQRSQAGVVDVEVHDKCRDHEAQARVERVRKGNVTPGLAEEFKVFRLLGCGIVLLPLSPPDDALHLLSDRILDGVCDEQMAGHEGVENSCEFDVLHPVVVAPYADENSILRYVSKDSQHERSCYAPS